MYYVYYCLTSFLRIDKQRIKYILHQCILLNINLDQEKYLSK